MASTPAPLAPSPSPAASGSRCYVTHHQGVDVVVIDLAHTTPEEAIPIMTKAGELIESFPAHSVRAFTDATGAIYSKESFQALKALTIHNTPHIKASAVVGADGLRVFAMKAVAVVTQRHIRPFRTREEALDWLVSVE